MKIKYINNGDFNFNFLNRNFQKHLIFKFSIIYFASEKNSALDSQNPVQMQGQSFSTIISPKL
jgi:hypothetical protein